MYYLLGAMLIAALLSAPALAQPVGEALYRVNCGADEAYVDADGAAWLPDQEWGEAAEWGAVGGNTVAREPALPVPKVPAHRVYFTERFQVRQYRFRVPNGTYTVRLHFAETHATNFGPGARVFHVAVEGRRVLTDFDPYREGGGFARPCTMEVAGIVVADGELNVAFEPQTQNAAINGIEVLHTPGAESGVSKLTDPAAFGPAVASTALDMAAEGRPAKILFTGHSYTLWWDLPGTVTALVNSGQSDVRLVPDSVLRGGADLERIVGEEGVLDRIRNGGYDYVVQGTTGGPDATESFHRAVRDGGAKGMVYCLWVPVSAQPEEQEPRTREQLEVARRMDAVFVPVGPAWQIVRQRRPDLRRHDESDGHHPALAGSYLTACVFYSVLTGRSPVGHPCTATMAGQVPLDEPTARALQEAAWEAVQRYRL